MSAASFDPDGKGISMKDDQVAAADVLTAGATDTDSEQWELRLYVAGQTARSLTAFANLKRICEEHLQGRYSIEVIDLVERPQLAADEQIFALPTLIRKLPSPVRKIVGDLSNPEHALIGLQLRPKRA